MSVETPLKLAIIGGGLAGVTLGNALIQHPHIEVHIYESAPQFSERGAAVGLAINAQTALHQLLPQASEMLKKTGAVPMNSTRVMVGGGPYTGDLVFDLAGTDPGVVIHRASLLRELLAPLPKEALHANKKLSKISETPSGVEVSFTDGTTVLFDAVIGADGIFSTVRDYILRDVQDTKDDCKASPAGFWDCRNLVPFEKAKAALGEELFKLDRQYGWVSDGAFIMHDVLENGTIVQCVICAVEKDQPQDRGRPLTKELLDAALANSLESAHTKAMIDLLLDQPEPKCYSEWEHKKTPTYASGRVCIIGDAAHATTPWQGSGAGMAIEDAMVLGKLLANVRSPSEVEAAFLAFKDVRLPRCQRIIDSSRETGTIFCGQDPEARLEPEKLKEALMMRWGHIYGIDHEEHIVEALRKFETYKSKL
ncbi:salicylate hydroxylase [Nemania sp. FL0031]|nr:salicylate hydroxylase [Nemania sp. FL0031]